MSPRNTTTGQVLEAMIVPSLQRGGYEVSQQIVVGERPGGRHHIVDAVASKDGHKFLVSLKWQQVSSTAEQKVPFEVICLADGNPPSYHRLSASPTGRSLTAYAGTARPV